MEERSIQVLENRTFFSKITTAITKLLIPTKVSINGIMISIKRNTLLKAYNSYELASDIDDAGKKESLCKKYEDSYALYLEAIDKYIMDSVYKKVKNNTASNFEREALSKYYTIVRLRDNQYAEYKYKKQEYLIKVDFETINDSQKGNLIEKYNQFYVSKMDMLYKGMLKNYSIQLADRTNGKLVYDKIFDCLEDYITDVLGVKIKLEDEEEYKNIISEYEKYQEVTIGKLDSRDIIRKKMVLLGLSRFLFTHSLPLIAAEECYIKLIKEGREILLSDSNKAKRDKTYSLLIELMDDYNVKLLSTKVYWDRPEERENYKKFWDKYKALDESNEDEYAKQKEILFLKYDLHELNKKQKKYTGIVQLYKDELVELGAMKEIGGMLKSKGNYVKAKSRKLE